MPRRSRSRTRPPPPERSTRSIAPSTLRPSTPPSFARLTAAKLLAILLHAPSGCVSPRRRVAQLARSSGAWYFHIPPCRTLTPGRWFSEDFRPNYVKEHSSVPLREVAKIAGETWNSLPDSEKQVRSHHWSGRLILTLSRRCTRIATPESVRPGMPTRSNDLSSSDVLVTICACPWIFPGCLIVSTLYA